jgi:large subunit ribosomal protein L7Ae
MGKDSKSTAAAAGKGAAAAKPAVAKAAKKSDGPKKDFHSTHGHLFQKDAADYRIGRDIQPKRDLSRFVKWPRYVRLQRQRAVLKKRLKVPPSINQFTRTLDKNNADALFRLLAKYRPESKDAKKKRLIEVAKQRVADEKAAAGKKDPKADAKKAESAKPILLKYGINHVTTLVEQKKAKLVVIAHDVDPIEIVVWLPALCRKMEVPFVIVKSKARLGMVVHKKTATALAVTEVKPEDAGKLEQLIASAKLQFNDDVASIRKWGGGVLGSKAQAVVRRREKAAAREASKKQGQ